jgi:hypothetical protein
VTAKLKLDGMKSQPGQKIAKQHVRAKLEVYPHSGEVVWNGRKDKVRTFSWDADKTEGTILSLNTIKTLGAPSGTWQASVKVAPDSDLDITQGDIVDGDWVDITYMRNGVEFPVMRGVVDSARQRKITSGGATVRVFNITGRDHGAPFETPIAWQSLWVQTLGELVRGIMTDKVKGAIGGSPDEMFEILVQAALDRGSRNKSNWQLPPELAKIATESPSDRPYFYEALNIDAADTRGAYYNEVQLWTQPGQTLHQTLQQWCNPLLNEIFYDLDVRKIGQKRYPDMYAIIRERPFVNTADGLNSPWYELDELELPDWIIQDYDIGRDGSQRYTLIELIADFGFINPQEAAAFAAPIWNQVDIQTHGLKPWQENVRYVAKDGKAQGQWLEERKAWQKLVVDWYAPNPYFGSGSLGAGILIPEARIGTKVKYDTGAEKTSEHYYLEGVENKYSYDRAGHHGKTSLTVTRGWPGSDKAYLDMVTAAAKNYKEVF